MKISVWNVRGLYGEEKLLLEELKKAKADIKMIPDTKKETKVFARVGSLHFIVQWGRIEQESSCRNSNND